MAVSSNDDKYNRPLARYLLDYSEEEGVDASVKGGTVGPNPSSLTDSQLLAEINKILVKIKPFQQAGLSGYKHFRQSGEKIVDPRHLKEDMLEEHHVYDKFVGKIVREICTIAIALLSKLEKMHKKGVLCGNVNPYNFMYNSKRRQCEPRDLSVVLSDPANVKAKKQLHGDLLYVHVDLSAVEDNKYLAPELQQTMKVFSLQRRLKNLKYVADSRGLVVENADKIFEIIQEFHRQKVVYSNKAEIYSVGYTLNQILSHLLEKLAVLGLSFAEPTPEHVDPEIVAEADALLPEHYSNPYKEHICELLNECVECIHDLMKEHVEQRDSLPESIEKFRSILKRMTIIEPDNVMDEGDAKGEELEVKRIELEEDESEEIEEDEVEEKEGEQEEEEHEEKEDEKEEEEREQEELEQELEEHEEAEEEKEQEKEEEKEEDEREEEREQEEAEEEHERHLHEEHLHEEHEHEAHEHEAHDDHEEHEGHEAHEGHEEHAGHESHEGHESHAGGGQHGAESHDAHDSSGHEHAGEHKDAQHDQDPSHTTHARDHTDLDVAHDRGATRTPGTVGYKPTTMPPRRR